MIYLLTIIIVLLSIAIVTLSVNFRKAKLSHREKVAELRFALVQLTADNEHKLAQLQLSDDLKNKLQATREKLDKDLVAVQYDLVEILSKNSLID